MSETFANNKRIAKNTLLLYFRMLLTMLVTLYTSRVILHTLGVEDYGIYNVVGTFVSMFSVLSGSLSAAISRFITFELGRDDKKRLKQIFSSAVIIQITLAFIIMLLAETIGLWFLNSKMVIPSERIVAANWVYQFSIITFGINLISVPYNAAIIAHEKMSAFAYISILEVIGKLIVAYCIVISPIDRLISYGFLLMSIAIAIRLIYGWYCKKHFTECSLKMIFDRNLLSEIFGFAGWNFIGAISGVLRDQGGNIIINMFGGPIVNAARGISVQVSHAIFGFATNFMTAINPQITKSYASADYEYMLSLIYKGARFAFYLLLIISLPVIVNTPYILSLWLGIVPEHTVLFVRLALILAMCDAISHPLITAMLATGRIRNYQLVVGGIQLLNLPISYLLLKYGAIPEIVTIVAIILSITCLFARLIMLQRLIHISMLNYVKQVLMNILSVGLISCILPIFLCHYQNETFSFFLLNSTLCILCTCLCIYLIGCTTQEQLFFRKKILIIKDKLLKL